jgi:hypothetical protein
MKPSILAVSGAIIGAIALSACAPVAPVAPPAPTCAAFASPPPAAPPPAAFIPPPVHHHIARAAHPVAHHATHRYVSVTRRTYRWRAETPGCGNTEHPCNLEHITVPIR